MFFRNIYKEKLENFKVFCQLYDKHITYYNHRVDDILNMLPEFNSCTIYYDVDGFCFIFKSNNWQQNVSDEIFETFDIYNDIEFISKKEELYNLYKPGFFEAYRNGGQTYHAQDMEKIINPLLNRLYEYKINFKLIR